MVLTDTAKEGTEVRCPGTGKTMGPCSQPLGGGGVGLSVPERQAEALDTRDGLWDGLGSRAFRTLGEWTPEAGGKVVSLLFLK